MSAVLAPSRLDGVARPAVQADLVFDLGMNDGEDTAYYLRKGYRVVAVEANPALCRLAEATFTDALRQGRLALVPAAISDDEGPNQFFVNTTNPHWSSLDRGWACKAHTEVQAVAVPGVRLDRLFDTHGVPHYLKIDIEGADLLALRQLGAARERPAYVSVEDCGFGFEYLEQLAALGYRCFQLADQHAVGGSTDEATGHRFRLGASGPFGADLRGAWLALEPFIVHYERTIRDRATRQRKSPPEVWWDIHAARG